MAVSKVVLNGTTLMDTTQKTVTAETMLNGTTALKNDGTDITGNIATKTSSNMTVSGATVTAPAGYYASDAIKSVASGSAGTASWSKSTVMSSPVKYKITVSYPNFTAGYMSSLSNSYVEYEVDDKTVAPSTSSQTITADTGHMLNSVTVGAMPSGTAGTPTATKGTVSNHQVTITPSVTNTTGYITGGTKTGTGVTVTASELASGSKSISANGTGIDVVGYSTVDVSVSGSSTPDGNDYYYGTNPENTPYVGYGEVDSAVLR